jgi:hypothetical protein
MGKVYLRYSGANNSLSGGMCPLGTVTSHELLAGEIITGTPACPSNEPGGRITWGELRARTRSVRLISTSHSSTGFALLGQHGRGGPLRAFRDHGQGFVRETVQPTTALPYPPTLKTRRDRIK